MSGALAAESPTFTTASPREDLPSGAIRNVPIPCGLSGIGVSPFAGTVRHSRTFGTGEPPSSIPASGTFFN